MRCPVCNDLIVRGNGENREDFHCKNMKCSSRTEISYYPHVSVKEGWYFAAGYHLPFRSGDNWFCLVGPEKSFKNDGFMERTVLQSISCIPRNFYMMHQQTYITSTKYYALPVNEDFNREFDIIATKLMGMAALK